MIVSTQNNTASPMTALLRNNISNQNRFEKNGFVQRNKTLDEFISSVNSSVKDETVTVNKLAVLNLSKIDYSDPDTLDAIAYHSYCGMQGICEQFIEYNVKGIDEYNQLEDEKAYYESLMSDDKIYFGENDKKYAFANVVKTNVSTEDVKTKMQIGDVTANFSNDGVPATISSKIKIDKDQVKTALEDVQNRINDFVTYGYGSKDSSHLSCDRLSGLLFKAAADEFANASPDIAAKYRDALNIEGDNSFNSTWNRTEENFLDEANKTISSLKNRSQGLYCMVNDYCEERRLSLEELETKSELSNIQLYARTYSPQNLWNLNNDEILKGMSSRKSFTGDDLERIQEKYSKLDIYA